ncbi:MAG: AI-2E family transporter [Bacteroidetes bacterium]|nr:MAG: AI-2E family transporter [Bacteroidota bacterium]
MSNTSLEKESNNPLEISIRLALLFLLIAWCLVLLYPFIEPVLWGVIIAVSVSPLYHLLNNKIGNRPKLSASIIILVFLAIIIVPAFLLIRSSSETLISIGKSLADGSFHIPPPSEKVASWPIIGEEAYSTWKGFSENLEDAIFKYKTQVTNIGIWLADSVLAISGDVLGFVLSIIISGVLLATKGTNEITHKFFKKLAGKRGNEFAALTEKTISSVTKGILGVAVLQGVIFGILFSLAGIPYAILWATIGMLLSILQIPTTILAIPIAIYLFSVSSATSATIWSIIIILSSFVDSVMKPILLGQGAAVPTLVIFLGAIGGFMVSGFLGLFTGAIVLSLGYKLFIAWIEDDGKSTETSNG